MKNVAALILAAGDSTRMGKPKALLPIGDDCFLGKVVSIAREAGLEPVYIVIGAHGSEIRARFPEMEQFFIRNEKPELGQLHSLHLGIRVLPKSADGLCMFLVDHPLIKTSTVKRLIKEFTATGKQIIIPTFKGTRGHPVLFGKMVFADLLRVSLEMGAKPVVREQPERVAVVEVDDPGVIADIDTPEAYERYVLNA